MVWILNVTYRPCVEGFASSQTFSSEKMVESCALERNMRTVPLSVSLFKFPGYHEVNGRPLSYVPAMIYYAAIDLKQHG